MKMQRLASFAHGHRRLVSLIIGLSTLSVAAVAVAAIVSGNSTTGASNHVTYTQLPLSVPTVSAGDVMIASLAIKGGAAAVMVTVPSGWTQIARTDNDTNISLISYWKIASASDAAGGASYTWTIQDQTRAEGGITGYSGVDTSSPIDVASTNTGRSKIATTTAVTTSASNEEVIALFATDVGTTSGSGYFSAPTTTSMTTKYNASNAALGPSIAAFDMSQLAAGNTGSIAAATGDNKTRDWATQNIALRQTSTVVTIDSSGTWTPPAGVTSVTVDMWGAGGGSGTGSNFEESGGAGAYVHATTVPVTPGNVYTVTIGSGGTGGATSTGGTGGSGFQSGGNGSVDASQGGGGGGGSTSFANDGTTLIACGGGGGAGGTTNASASGSSGGVGDGSSSQGAGGGGGCSTPGGNASGNSGGPAGTGGTTMTGTPADSRTAGGATGAGSSGNGHIGAAGVGGIGSGGAAGGTSGTPDGANGTGTDSGGGGWCGCSPGAGNGGHGGQPAAAGGGSLADTSGTGGKGRVVITY
jgi:hypothetical protein